MKNEFEIVAGFLERVEGEVEGRELTEPSAEVEERLRQFARGQLPPAQQTELMTLLSRNPRYISRLAEEVKGLRKGAGPETTS